ncbi:MAG: ComEC/Rec2 family competence protein [Clostridia bacterium]|nr:ComEC/Rec2 family competence protein [Clostridia bacterium]
MLKRYLMWTLATFYFTILLCSFLSFELAAGIAVVVLALMIPVAFIRFSLKKLILPCQAALVAAVIFFTVSQLPAQKTQTELVGRSAEISGIVTDLGTNAAGNLSRYQIKLTAINGKKLPFYHQFYVYLYSDTESEYSPGAGFQGTLEFFDTAIEFGGGREDRVFISSFSSNASTFFSEAQKENYYHIFYEFRNAIQNRLCFGDTDTIGLMRSVCFGDTESLDSRLNVSLRRIGLSHVTSVSGLHLTFTVLLFSSLLALLGIHYRIRHIVNIFVAVFFTAIVWFPLSCVRACIMLSILSLGMALNLFPDGLTSLSVAAFLIVVFNPLAIRDVGFLLSVFATAGIILLRSPIETFLFPKKVGKNHHINSVYRKFTGIFACSIAATLATLPIVISVFKTVSLIGPLANVILIYPLQAVFMLGMMMVMLGWIPGIGAAIGFICDFLYDIIDLISDLIGRFPYSSVTGFNLQGIIILVLFIAITGVAIYDFIRHQRRSFIALFLMLLCFSGTFGLIYKTAHPDDSVEIAFIDVGQGECTVISKDNRAVIFDYGGSSEKRYNLIDYLQKKNIYVVELLAFTHLHSDHTNGLRTLLRNVYVDQILYPEFEFETAELLTLIQSEKNRIISGDETISVLDDVSVSLITAAAFDETLANRNERCICYHVCYGDTSVLVTGDLEGDAEIKLLNYELNCTILKVAHHGSDSSSLYPFLKAASPEIAVISVGENSYGHPSASVIDRLETISARILKTSDGNIIFKSNGTTLERIIS